MGEVISDEELEKIKAELAEEIKNIEEAKVKKYE